jgi:hypothetical protein
MHRYAIFAVMLWGISCAAPQKATTPETVVRMRPVKKSRCKNLKWTSLQPLLRAYSKTPPNSTEGEELRKDLVCYAKSFMEWMEVYDAAVNSRDQALKQQALIELPKTAKRFTDWEELYSVSVKEKDAALQRKVVKNLFATAEEFGEWKRFYLLVPKGSVMQRKVAKELAFVAKTCDDWASIFIIAPRKSVLEYMSSKMIFVKKCCLKKGFAEVPDGATKGEGLRICRRRYLR